MVEYDETMSEKKKKTVIMNLTESHSILEFMNQEHSDSYAIFFNIGQLQDIHQSWAWCLIL